MSALHKTYLVTFPRSGQHIIARGLMYVMPDLVVYSERYQVEHRFDNNPAVNLQKEHDFDLSLPFIPQYKYVIATRGFVAAIRSWWQMSVANGSVPDTEEAFARFLEGKYEYWLGFNQKWHRIALEGYNTNVLFLEFDCLRAYTEDALRQVVDLVVDVIPEPLRYCNTRPEAFEAFGQLCKRWLAMPRPPFMHARALDDYWSAHSKS